MVCWKAGKVVTGRGACPGPITERTELSMTESRDERNEGNVEGPLQIEIAPPEGAVLGILEGQGTQEPHEYHTVLWTLPEGTTRELIAGDRPVEFWRITLPGGRQLLEMYSTALQLSVLKDDGGISDPLIS